MGIDLDLRRLRFFVEVVRQGGFSQAARVVFATQPTVSKAVKQLEDELGVPLLQRVGRGSEMTAAGKIVYERALGLLNASDDLVTELNDLRGLKRGKLRIGFPRLGSSALFAPAFVAFRRDYPGIDVELAVDEPKKLEAMLEAGELDLAALTEPVPPGLDSQHVLSEPLVVLLRRDHPLAARDTVKLASLLDQPFILAEEGASLNDVILDACRAKGFSPQIALRSGQLEFIFELVAAGVGIAFLPRVIAEKRSHRTVRCVLLEGPKCYWRIVLAWRQGGYLSQAARAWLAHMRGEPAGAR
jgi:DNA-binding transcriptional LysR family regulator